MDDREASRFLQKYVAPFPHHRGNLKNESRASPIQSRLCASVESCHAEHWNRLRPAIGVRFKPFLEMVKMEAYTQQQLEADLKNLGVSPQRPLFVHSSMRAIGSVLGGADTVLDAFFRVMKGGLLIFPTHTWSSIKQANPIFDPMTEPCCVGILPELFRKRPGVVRSTHPTHSVAAHGPGSKEIISHEALFDTPCPRGGFFGKLVDQRGQVLFLGCPLTKNTLIHAVEEWDNVPERLEAVPKPLKVRQANGDLQNCPVRGHSSPYGDVSRFYDKLLEPFRFFNIISEGHVGDAHGVLGDAEKMAAMAAMLLKKDPNLFSDDRAVHPFFSC